jgi:hypothetical protein
MKRAAHPLSHAVAGSPGRHLLPPVGKLAFLTEPLQRSRRHVHVAARADAEAPQLLRHSLVVANEIVELKYVDLAGVVASQRVAHRARPGAEARLRGTCRRPRGQCADPLSTAPQRRRERSARGSRNRSRSLPVTVVRGLCDRQRRGDEDSKFSPQHALEIAQFVPGTKPSEPTECGLKSGLWWRIWRHSQARSGQRPGQRHPRPPLRGPPRKARNRIEMRFLQWS